MTFFKKFQSVLMLIGSNSFSALIIAVGTLIITRLLSPQQYGLYSYIAQLSVALYPLLTLRYEQALPLLGNRTIAKSWLVFGSLGLLLIITLLMAVVVATILFLVGDIELGGILTASALPLVLFMSSTLAISAVFQFEAISENRLSMIALARVARAIILVVLQVAFVVVFDASALWLVFGESVSNISQAIILAGSRKLEPRRRVLRRSVRVAASQVLKLFSLYLVFPTVNLVHLLSHGALGIVFATVLGMMYGQDALGQYFLMRRLLFGVLSIFVTAVYQNAVAEASQSNEREVYSVAKRSFFPIGLVGMLTGLWVLFFSVQMFEIVAGPQWATAGVIAVASLPLIFFEPLTAVMHFVAVFLKKQKNAFLVSLFQGAVGVLALMIAAKADLSLFQAILASSAAMSTIMCSYIVYLFFLARSVASHGNV